MLTMILQFGTAPYSQKECQSPRLKIAVVASGFPHERVQATSHSKLVTVVTCASGSHRGMLGITALSALADKNCFRRAIVR